MTATTACKWVFIFVCFAISMGAGLLPMKIKGFNSNPRYMGIANSFSGGVFLAIAFCHIMPEAANIYYNEKLQKLLKKHQSIDNPDEYDLDGAVQKLVTQEEVEDLIDEYQSSFPLPYLLVVLGYAFILFIDRVVVDSHEVEVPIPDTQSVTSSAVLEVDDDLVDERKNNRGAYKLQREKAPQTTQSMLTRPNCNINDAEDDLI